MLAPEAISVAKAAEEAHLELRTAYFANATQGQIQLVRLKKHWWDDGVGEVEIPLSSRRRRS